ncbi:hypothetical protein F0M17_16790 [Glutamicibacter sp. ZJUTW]|nr:hypothetical protein F0M17_16790 [Glutamicibacter sp. ZJUTW]
MGMNFTAIDFETANGKRASVCAVGLVKVRNGEIVDRDSWLITPPPGFTTFAEHNVKKHGITEADIVGAPSWAESARRIREFVAEDVAVAHYAAFDKSVWHQACEWSGVDFGDFDWVCSRDLAKAHLGLDDCTLPSVADTLGITGLDHHNAASDASVCAQIILAIADRAGVSSWTDLHTVTPQKTALSRSGRPYASEPSIKKGDLPEPNLDADPDHELYGQGLTITGGFQLLGRLEAFNLAASFGAIAQLGTTRKTSILVVCDENPHAPGFDLSKGTTKSKKAHEYMTDKGQQIRIMSETEFYAAVGMAPASMVQAIRRHTEPEPHSTPQSSIPQPELAVLPASPAGAPTEVAGDELEYSEPVRLNELADSSTDRSEVERVQAEKRAEIEVKRAEAALLREQRLHAKAEAKAAAAPAKQERRAAQAKSALNAGKTTAKVVLKIVAWAVIVFGVLFVIAGISLWSDGDAAGGIGGLIMGLIAGTIAYFILRAGRNAR